MLTEIKAYSSWQSAPTLYLDDAGRAETDLIQIRNVDGLDPVTASVGTTPYGSSDGESYVGSSVLSRNLVLTLHPNPNWINWSPEALRRFLYAYFMPKGIVQLEFYSDDMDPVDIRGVVESFAANPFSKDPEYIASVICPDPYFTAIEPVVMSGSVNDVPVDVDYFGNVNAGIQVKVQYVSGTAPNKLTIQVGDPNIGSFEIDIPSIVTAAQYFQMSSVSMSKYVENIANNGTITSLLSYISPGSSDWPMLQPGRNKFSVTSDHGIQNWELTYFEKFGAL